MINLCRSKLALCRIFERLALVLERKRRNIRVEIYLSIVIHSYDTFLGQKLSLWLVSPWNRFLDSTWKVQLHNLLYNSKNERLISNYEWQWKTLKIFMSSLTLSMNGAQANRLFFKKPKQNCTLKRNFGLCFIFDEIWISKSDSF